MAAKKEPIESPSIDLFATAIEAQARMAAMAWHFNATLLSETATLNNEVMDFIQRRISKDLEAASALGKCDFLEKAMETLGEFQKRAVNDYTEETAKLSALNTHASDAIIAEVAEDTEMLADLKRKAA